MLPVACALTGCQSPKAGQPFESSASRHATRSDCYRWLHHLLDEQKDFGPLRFIGWEHAADSDESGHLFQSMSDTIPILSDSCRSEATLFVTYKRVSDRSQDFAISFAFIRSPFQGRRFDPPPEDVVAPSIRAGEERPQPTPELQFGLPPVATRNGLTRPSE